MLQKFFTYYRNITTRDKVALWSDIASLLGVSIASIFTPKWLGLDFHKTQAYLVALVDILFFSGLIVLLWALVISLNRFIMTWPRLGAAAPRSLIAVGCTLIIGLTVTVGLVYMCLTIVQTWLQQI